MATDYLYLFNKSLADKILAMNEKEVIDFLESNLPKLNLEHRSINYYLESGFNESTIELIISDFCFEGERIPVDYWGCSANVNLDDSISYFDLFPESEEELFVLLTNDKVNEIIKSLEARKNDLDIKTTDKIVQMRNFCLKNPDYMVAYNYDF